MKILMTGGSGNLGQEILKLDQSIIAPTHSELDVTDQASIEEAAERYRPDIFLHLAAARPEEFEKDPKLGLRVNIIGTANAALVCLEQNIKLVYVSTDFVYQGEGPHKENEPILPSNKFSWSKVGGECAVQILPNSLILRPSMGPYPFPWPKVFEDQYNSRLYFEEAAPLILAATKSNLTGILNLGGPRSTMIEYAHRSNPNSIPSPRPESFPKDTSFDLEKMKSALDIEDEHSILKY